MEYGYQKVINNNVISAYDVNQQEIVIMGKGIGFKAHTGELIDESKIEKFFVLRMRIFPDSFRNF